VVKDSVSMGFSSCKPSRAVRLLCRTPPPASRALRFAPRPYGTGPDGPALDAGSGVWQAAGREATLKRRFVEKRLAQGRVAVGGHQAPGARCHLGLDYYRAVAANRSRGSLSTAVAKRR